MKNLIRIVAVCIAFSILIPGVFALWRYSLAPATPVDGSITAGMAEFVYEEFKGVYIKNVEVVTHLNAINLNNSFDQPASHITSVDSAREGGYITYRITFHNNTNVTYWYTGSSYSADYGQNNLIGQVGGVSIKTTDQFGDSDGTFNSEDWIPPQTERNVYVTYTYGSNAQDVCMTKVDFKFDIKMDAVQDEFLAVLNDTEPGSSYEMLAEVFNKQYAETGKVSISTETHPEVFASLFEDLVVIIDGEEKQASVVIRRENLDSNSSSGDDYSGSGPVGCEYTLYITVESLTPETSPTVYAIAYSCSADGMGDMWYQIGELYEGTAPINADGTIDYANWRATPKTYVIADGIEYKVAAPNGDQYDIMTTMEQLISAVDQDIFNEIDNKNIFKKVYDIIVKHQGSSDPAIVGLRTAFENASIFYRNLNNGAEFKVVRDRYTRAEIIYALQNIQKALDYYYQVFPE